MKRIHENWQWLIWPASGFLAGLVGWGVGGLFGSYLPRTMCAAAFVGGLHGLLSRNGLLASGAFLAGGAGSALGFLMGAPLSPPLFGWIFAGLSIGLMSGLRSQGVLKKILASGLGAMSGLLGFVLGALIAIGLGFLLSQALLMSEFMGAGAAGFGAMTMLGLKAPTLFRKRRPSLSDPTGPPGAVAT